MIFYLIFEYFICCRICLSQKNENFNFKYLFLANKKQDILFPQNILYAPHCTFPGLRHVAACCFSKELCANPRNTSANRMRGIALSCLQKCFVNSKAFGVKRLITYWLKIKLKGEFEKYWYWIDGGSYMNLGLSSHTTFS